MADIPKVDNTVLIPGGFSQMGRTYTSGSEAPVDPELTDQSPPHVVNLNPFYVQKYAVTNEEYLRDAPPMDQYELVKQCMEPDTSAEDKYQSCLKTAKKKKSCVAPVAPSPKKNVDTVLARGPVESVLLDVFKEVLTQDKDRCTYLTRAVNEQTKAHSPDGFNGLKQPAVNTTWFEADVFCHAKKGRLLTEAERESIGRGFSDFPIEPDTILHSLAEPRTFIFATKTPRVLISSQANYGTNFTMPVGSFPPTALGLYDLTGNAWEWVNDWYAPYEAGASILYNPTGPETGETKVIRGGGFLTLQSKYLSATYRTDANPYTVRNDITFRCAFDVNPVVAAKKESKE